MSLRVTARCLQRLTAQVRTACASERSSYKNGGRPAIPPAKLPPPFGPRFMLSRLSFSLGAPQDGRRNHHPGPKLLSVVILGRPLSSSAI